MNAQVVRGYSGRMRSGSQSSLTTPVRSLTQQVMSATQYFEDADVSPDRQSSIIAAASTSFIMLDNARISAARSRQ
jgi:hypothetical protein